MTENKYFVVFILLIFLTSTCVSQSFKGNDKTIIEIDEILPKAFLRGLSTGNDSKNQTEGFQNNSKYSELFRNKKVVLANKCNEEYLVDTDAAFLLTSSFSPQISTCEQQFTPKSNDTLDLNCESIYMRFNCHHESLTIATENTTVVICGSTPIRDIFSSPIRAKEYINLTYHRNLFGLHGGYLCVIAIQKILDKEEIKQPSKPIEFLDCHACGTTPSVSGRSNFVSRRRENIKKTASTRIVGGISALKGQYPWMTYLAVHLDDGKSLFMCGGALVTPSIVVTAAHCLEDQRVKKIEAGFGVTDITKTEVGSAWRFSSNYTIHPAYDTNTVENDIAVIFIYPPLKMSDTIQSICLPSSNLNDLAGLTAVATGWGRLEFSGGTSNTLQSVKLGVWSKQMCSNTWENFIGSPLSDFQMCAYTDEKDTCTGDSGGPLAIQLNSRWILAGVTSYGYKCAEPGIPGVYTRVSGYINWIKSFFKKSQCKN